MDDSATWLHHGQRWQAVGQLLSPGVTKPRVKWECKHLLQSTGRPNGTHQPLAPLQACIVCWKCTPEWKTYRQTFAWLSQQCRINETSVCYVLHCQWLDKNINILKILEKVQKYVHSNYVESAKQYSKKVSCIMSYKHLRQLVIQRS